MLTIGIMSGTSLDGADAVLADTDGEAHAHLLGHVHRPFADGLRSQLAALQTCGTNEIERAARAANALADHFAALAHALLLETGCGRADVEAIGAHGQTVRHRPDQAFTVQINAPARLAERTGIDVIADFRSRDVAAGGQGAPLVPAFHAAVFRDRHQHRAVLNLGGIANLTDLPTDPAAPVRGWDCGPANVLMDEWTQRHRGRSHDGEGTWARSGRVSEALLSVFLKEAWLDALPPKSTGRDLFNAAWLEARLASLAPCRPEDVQATLVEFTAQCAATSLRRHIPAATSLVVCGGGAFNHFLLERLTAWCGPTDGAHAITVQTSDTLGVRADQVEALAFAWLAARFIRRLPGNLPAVTGAQGSRILGALYPA